MTYLLRMQQKARRFLYSLQRTIGVRNPWQVAVYAVARARGAAGQGRYGLEPRIGEHPFDLEYGVQTGGLIASDPADATRHAYYGVSPSVFGRACRLWQKTLPPGVGPEACTFVDLGAGMGRALLLASQFPFRRVVGVEVKGELVDVARRNIASWVAAGRAKSPIEILKADVLHFSFPDGPLLIFLYNPFGEEILQQILDRLPSVTPPATIDVLYVHPIFGFLFGQRGDFERLWMKLVPLDSVDAKADAFRSTFETCVAYRRGPRKPGPTAP